jgi:hypothetical protein
MVKEIEYMMDEDYQIVKAKPIVDESGNQLGRYRNKEIKKLEKSEKSMKNIATIIGLLFFIMSAFSISMAFYKNSTIINQEEEIENQKVLIEKLLKEQKIIDEILREYETEEKRVEREENKICLEVDIPFLKQTDIDGAIFTWGECSEGSENGVCKIKCKDLTSKGKELYEKENGILDLDEPWI